ncbi:hypothetical protein C0J52_21765 [Blattella germanica]|nr:hypothetical protein C0J52_21765 [Blattella germanica]
MRALKALFIFSCSVLLTSAQNPLGGCPEKNVPMPDFDLSRYLGVWYESERSFTVLEAGNRCVRSNYTQTADGKVHVENEATNRLTSIKRVLEGEMKMAGKATEGKINIKYSVPLPLEATYHVLKTDYESYSVIWYCLSLGLLNAQYAWIMTRERQPPGPVLQSAYGVLDEFDIPRTFFLKTDQKDCDITAQAPDVVPVNPDPPKASTPEKQGSTVPEKEESVRTPSKEMLPPEPSNKPSEMVMEDTEKKPVEMSEDNKETSEKIKEKPVKEEEREKDKKKVV